MRNHEDLWVQTEEGTKEILLEEIVDVTREHNAVLFCCIESDLKLVSKDKSELSCVFHIYCKSCNKKGKSTDWSHAEAIALWNMQLWNPTYMSRDPIKLAESIEKLQKDLANLTLADIKTVLNSLKNVPKMIRKLVIESESNRISKYMSE